MGQMGQMGQNEKSKCTHKTCTIHENKAIINMLFNFRVLSLSHSVPSCPTVYLRKRLFWDMGQPSTTYKNI